MRFPNHFKLSFLLLSILWLPATFAIRLDPEFQARVAAENPKLNPVAIRKAFKYLSDHLKAFENQDYLSIVNFDQDWDEERLYIIKLNPISEDAPTTSRYLVAHGMGSRDPNDWTKAVSFSNEHESKKSALGFYRTAKENETFDIHNSKGEIKAKDRPGIYEGKHGKSLILVGLQKSNNKAVDRMIIVHAAKYVSQYRLENMMDHINLSWGCPAVDEVHREEIFDKIEGRSLFYIYSTAGLKALGEDTSETKSKSNSNSKDTKSENPKTEKTKSEKPKTDVPVKQLTVEIPKQNSPDKKSTPVKVAPKPSKPAEKTGADTKSKPTAKTSPKPPVKPSSPPKEKSTPKVSPPASAKAKVSDKPKSQTAAKVPSKSKTPSPPKPSPKTTTPQKTSTPPKAASKSNSAAQSKPATQPKTAKSSTSSKNADTQSGAKTKSTKPKK